MQNKAYIAVDTSYSCGVVCAFSGTQILHQVVLREKLSHAKNIAQAISHCHEHIANNNLVCDGVLVGLGPGSFVGLRIALATAQGFAFGAGLGLMGFCSHRALAFSCHTSHEKIILLMKAAGDFYYCSEYEKNGEAMSSIASPHTILLSDINANLKDSQVLLTDQRQKLEKYFAQVKGLEQILGPSTEGVVKAANYAMAQSGGFKDQSAGIKPNYIKAPSVSLPKKPMAICHSAY